jgi:hypothetical protein
MTAFELKLAGTLELIAAEPPPPNCLVTLSYDGFTITVGGTEMAYTLPADRSVLVQVSYVDANGNPANVDGDVRWSSSDAEIIGVTVDPEDSFQATVEPGKALGQAQVIAAADADLGTGVRELICTMDVTVMAGEAVAGRIEPVGETMPR